MSSEETRTPKRTSATQSGIIPKALFEPGDRREASHPTTVPELRQDESATTGLFPVVSEGADVTAAGDTDGVKGN
ncbi:MAG: hypothetical protein H7Y11_07290 [Armatimonadetes bacterium]|nr:hypothetical protein [Anaerolineae bacterium]